jgi:hypothetical protein
MTADTVVCLPRRILALISRTRSLRPDSTALSRLDFPAPDGPVDRIPGRTKPRCQCVARCQVDLVDGDRGREVIHLDDGEETVE